MTTQIHNFDFKNVKYVSEDFITQIINETLHKLSNLKMVRFDPQSKIVNSTDLGRSASHFYINCETMDEFCHELKLYSDETLPQIDIDEIILVTMAKSKEFEQIRIRFDEMDDLKRVKSILKS